MTIRDGESGKRLVVITSFDMSSYTSLQLYTKDPDGNVSAALTATLGTTTTTNASGDAVAANEWAYYDTEATTFDEAGAWHIQLAYTNTATDPDDIFYTGWVALTVEAGASGIA